MTLILAHNPYFNRLMIFRQPSIDILVEVVQELAEFGALYQSKGQRAGNDEPGIEHFERSCINRASRLIVKTAALVILLLCSSKRSVDSSLQILCFDFSSRVSLEPVTFFGDRIGKMVRRSSSAARTGVCL